MGTSQEAREQRQHELKLAREAFFAEQRRVLPHWQFGVMLRGRWIGISAGTRSSHITGIYVLFNAVFFAIGVGFIFFRGVLQTLGVALVVGGLFSFGTFVSQFWVLEVQREYEVFNRAFDEEDKDVRYDELRRLAKRVWELSGKLENLDGSQNTEHDDKTN